jgi:hypothetical protein
MDSRLLNKYFNLLKEHPNLWNIESIQKPVNNELYDAGNFPNNIVEYYWISKDKIKWDYEINCLMKLNNGNYAFFYSGETLGGFTLATIHKKVWSDLKGHDDDFYATIMELYICKNFDDLIEIIKKDEILYKYYLLDKNI